MNTDDIRVLFDGATAVVAMAALVVGLFNYKQAAHRDKYRLRCAAKVSMVRDLGGSTEASTIETEIVNTGQRPVTVTDIALAWSRPGCMPRFSRCRRFWQRPRIYLWHSPISSPGIRLVENQPHDVYWHWSSVEDFLRSQAVHVGSRPRFDGILMNIGSVDHVFVRPRWRARVEQQARDILAGKLKAKR